MSNHKRESEWWKKWIRKYRRDYCENCRYTPATNVERALHVCRFDGNEGNNCSSNLITRCAKCVKKHGCV